ncbi:hypothetical protein OB919_20460 [Halobacteria archaeon AArc-curdl1]|uniref:Uncharacterized protein n=1 Tax=Natronosalvus hydrolyticus TaxID=2979988 RepID=A0AAP2ZD68_9EURY|nr:hypothetical protein [Halobacteria archaeon AArc-curdl1]
MNETAFNQTTGNQTADIEQAWNTVTSPESVEHFQHVFEAIGLELALLILVPFSVMFIYAGIRGLWEKTSFWLVYGTGLFTALIMLISFPFLLLYI